MIDLSYLKNKFNGTEAIQTGIVIAKGENYTYFYYINIVLLKYFLTYSIDFNSKTPIYITFLTIST